MVFFKRICFLLSLCACLTPSTLSARQLKQPASVLPWKAIQPEMKLALKGPDKSNKSDSPAWLIDTAKPLAQQPHAREEMPNVEKESFANMGQLKGKSAAQKKQANQRKHASSVKSGRSFSLLRALGIKANRSGSHR